MASWPSNLPDFTEMRVALGFGEGRSVNGSNAVFLQARSISGAPYDRLQVSADYTGTQLGALRTFYFTTVGQTVPFDHTDIETGDPCKYRFDPASPPPAFEHIQSALDAKARASWFWRVSFVLERLS
jgi:hypothetical protein